MAPTELATPRGHGLVRVAHDLRVHVPPHLWASTVGTDFWLAAGSADVSNAASATNIAGLDGYGWTATSVVFSNSVSADFMSSADDTPANFNADGANDTLVSPIIFGDYAHALAAGQLLGYLPTRLCAEFYAAFTTASANESASVIGFANGSGYPAAIYSDGTNFILSNNSATDTGALISTTYHQWKITVDRLSGLTEWFIDGTSQGTVANCADLWPVAFLFFASTTNRIALSWAHVWYE